MLRRAGPAEDLAVTRVDLTPEHVGALAGLVIFAGEAWHLKADFGIKISIGGGQFKGAIWNAAESAPFKGLTQCENLAADGLCFEVAALENCAFKTILHTDLARVSAFDEA